MSPAELYDKLRYVKASRENRMKYALMVLNEPILMEPLMNIMFKVEDKISSRAAWVFEFVCKENLEAILPLLDKFTKGLKQVHLDSTVRPVAKVCELLVIAYFSKKENRIKTTISSIHKDRIVEACFDWMITEQKIAPKAYAMNSLYLLGKEFDWIHPELITILQQEYPNESSGYKARARHIIGQIKNKQPN